jgi:Fe-S-cluster-containing hydrogenase component 2
VAGIKIDRDKCCECYLCETTCSLQYSKNTVNPKRSRVIAFFNKPDVDVISCDHCGEEPQCVKACLSDALAPCIA